MVNSQERRRYFRVTDLVGLSYRPLSEGETDLALTERPSSLSEVLSKIDSQIQVGLESLRSSNTELHSLLELMNQKINLAIGHGSDSEDQESNSDTMKATRVNISACGIAFPVDEAFAANQHLALDITLYPNHLNLKLIAAVIDCESLGEDHDDGRYLIRADYVKFQESDRELLVQHVIKRQTQELKDQRLAQENQDS